MGLILKCKIIQKCQNYKPRYLYLYDKDIGDRSIWANRR